MKRNHWFLITGIVIISILFFVMHYISGQKGAGEVTVFADGKMYGRYLLGKEQEIAINDTNVLRIENGTVTMAQASCPDQLCVHQKAISRNRESIICLPNQVVVEVTATEEKTYDAMTN